MLICHYSYAQVGIGTTSPVPSAALELKSENKGFLPPRLSEVEKLAILTPSIGLMIYNTTSKCLEFYNGSIWISPCQNSVNPTVPLVISNLDCSTGSIINSNSIDFVSGTEITSANGVQISIPYTVGTNGTFSDVSISSTGVSGLTAQAVGGNITSDGNLILDVTGTPAIDGNATFDISFGGQNCSFAIPITPPSVSLASLECGSSALINPNAVSLESGTTITSGDNLQVSIPYTVTTAGTYDAISISSTNITGLTAQANAGTINADGNLILNISGVSSGVGAANFDLSIGGQNCSFTINIIATAPSIGNIRCSNHRPKFFGNDLIEDVTVPNDLNTYIRVKYSTGNGQPFASESINSTGVTGLTATVAAGTLASGNGEVRFIISGTPTDNGNAIFPISFLGVTRLNCSNGQLIVPVSTPPAEITAIQCGGNAPTYNGNDFEDGLEVLASQNQKIVVKYSGGNGQPYASESINSTGVTGLTATVAAGTLTNAGGTVEFIISGTPDGFGTATFPISFLGENSSCGDGNVTVNVTDPTPQPLPGNVTLTAGQIQYLVSIYDNDYLPHSPITSLAAVGSENAGGGNEPLINIQGELTTTGQTILIPYRLTGSNNKTLQAFSQTKTVISAHVQGSTQNSNNGGGAARDVELSYPQQVLTPGRGFVTATIKAIGGKLKAVKLDINKGIGTDIGILLAEFTIATNSSGGTGKIQLKDVPGIPDRRFGEQTVQGVPPTLGYYHNNLYTPVTAEDGSVWLNNALGAIYNRLTNYDGTPNTDFNPAQSATSMQDYKAYGNFFQWGRYSDGHELVTFNFTPVNVSSSSTAVPYTPLSTNSPFSRLNGAMDISTLETTTNKNLTTNNYPSHFGKWHGNADQVETLWTGVNAPNNPCPYGFRIPTDADVVNLKNAINWGTAPADYLLKTEFIESLNIKFVFQDDLDPHIDGGLIHDYEYHPWVGSVKHPTSNGTGGQGHSFYMQPVSSDWPILTVKKVTKALGLAVRCIKN